MRNVLGTNLTLTLFGESHNEFIGATLDGICPGIKVDDKFIEKQLSKRRPKSNIETPRVENDNYKIISGVFNGYTTGAPLTILIENTNIKSKDYDSMKNIARPSHADYTAYVKYNGYNDYRGGGHFSGRITAPIVAIGSILIKALKERNIYIGTHILECGKTSDRKFENIEEDLKNLENKEFPVLNDIENLITEEIKNVASNNDSIGGILQTAITGLPVGLGEPWFSSVEGQIANAMFSIGGVKGIEFGAGFSYKDLTGSTSNDEFYIENDVVKTKTNNNGGINGGITNGMPIVFNLAVKPTPSISLEQETIDFVKKENTTLKINGRHDPAIIRRMSVVVDSLLAIVICDMLATRYGNDFLKLGE